MWTLRSIQSVAALVGVIAVAVGATGLTVTPAAAGDEPAAEEEVADEVAASEVTVVGVTFSPSQVDVSSGFATVTVDLALRSDVPIEDSIGTCYPLEGGTVYAYPAEGGRPWAAPGEGLVERLMWRGSATRVSGTSTDGVWRATTEVTPAWTGRWAASFLDDPFGCDNDVRLPPSAVFTVGNPQGPRWKVMQAPVAPMRVITGKETWTPRVRVTDRVTGVGVPAFMDELCPDTCIFSQPTRAAVGTTFSRAGSTGYWSLTPRAVNTDLVWGIVHAWAKRGSRGYSLEARGCFEPWVKWQVNARMSTVGRTVTVTGNAFPAPTIYRAANPAIRLQVLTNGRWGTASSARVRDNGRYTLEWTAPAAGTYRVRAYKPGGMEDCRRSVGTTLPAMSVMVR